MVFTNKISIHGSTTERTVLSGDKIISSSQIDTSEYAEKLGRYTHLDLGLFPEGVRFFRQNLGYAQVVVELPPGINRNIWGDEEGDPDAEHFMLAQPYRIIIIDFKEGNFFGARIFYSTTPIYNLDIPLYNANLSNINCYGYNGNAVGWLCIYNNENLSQYTWEYKIRRMIERCSGEEAFNFGNMSETDGIKLYSEVSPHYFLSDISIWEQKSQEEGYEWTLNSDLWIPIMVESEVEQSTNNFNNHIRNQNHDDEYDEEYEEIDDEIFKEGSVPLTLRMALNGSYAATYEDKVSPKPPSPNFSMDELNLKKEGYAYHVFVRSFISDQKQSTEETPF